MPMNPQILALLAKKAASGDEEAITNLATIIDREKPGGPPTTIEAPQQPFPVPPRGGIGAGARALGVANNPAPQPIPPAAPQALAAASNQSALGGGVPGGGASSGLDIGSLVQIALPIVLSMYGGGAGAAAGASGGGAGGGGIGAALGGLFGGGGAGAGAGSSAGPALAGGLPSGAAAGAAGGGVNPLEVLQPPTPGEPPQQPRVPGAIAPRPGGQINPQILQLIMQALSAGGGQPQVQQQSLGAILGGLR